MPFNRNSEFTGREDILGQLGKRFDDPERHPYVAIYGLGGCGKSAVAIEFAHQVRHGDPQCAIFWVSAFTAERFKASYREIARCLQIPGADDPEKDMLSPVQRQLSLEGHHKWLMIIDNLDDKILLFATHPVQPHTFQISQYLPHSRRGMIVVTTRRKDVAVEVAKTDAILLDQMSSNNAKMFLRKALIQSDGYQDDTLLEKFLVKLTFLPLAMVQAVAFINKNSSSLGEYMDLIQKTDQVMINALSDQFGDLSRDRESTNSIVTTWYISFRQIEKDDPLAALYLSVLACIAPQNIPKAMFISSSNMERSKVDAIGTLIGYSFLRKSADLDIYHMHTLVHLVAKAWQQQSPHRDKTSRLAIQQLNKLIPYGDHKRWREYEQLLPHGICAVQPPYVVGWEVTIDLLNRLGRCQTSLGRYREAEISRRSVLICRIEQLGKENSNTIKSMHEIAFLMAQQGKYFEAEQLHRECLELKEKVLGAEHPETLASMHNLAEVMSQQGKYVEAEQLHRECLKLSEKVLGAEHPSTLASMHNLASVIRQQGKYVEAERLHRACLELSEKVLGAEHPLTLASRANLASVIRQQGKYVEAERLHRACLELSEKVLGAEHPSTLASMHNLASVIRQQGKYVEAEQLHRACLELKEKVLGAEHPSTLASRANLAEVMSQQGKYVEAEQLHRACLELKEKVLGAEHPSTLASMHNLALLMALLMAQQGKNADAEMAFRKICTTRERILGKAHPNTLNSKYEVAAALDRQAMFDKAQQVYEEVFASRENVLGSDHPSTRKNAIAIFMIFLKQNKQDEAIQFAVGHISYFQDLLQSIRERSGPSVEPDQEHLRLLSRLADVKDQQQSEETNQAQLLESPVSSEPEPQLHDAPDIRETSSSINIGSGSMAPSLTQPAVQASQVEDGSISSNTRPGEKSKGKEKGGNRVGRFVDRFKLGKKIK